MSIELSLAIFACALTIYSAIKLGKLEERVKGVEEETRYCKYSRENKQESS